MSIVLNPSSGTSFTGGSPRCGTAAALLDEGEPRQAAELIDTIRIETNDPTACSHEAAAVGTRFVEVDVLISHAYERADGLPKDPTSDAEVEQWQDVQVDAEKVLELDQDNQRATDLKEKADTALEHATIGTTLQSKAKDWADATGDSGAKLATLAAIVIATLTATLFLARLLLLVPPSTRKRGNGRPRRTPAKWARYPWAAGIANAVAVAVVVWLVPKGLGTDVSKLDLCGIVWSALVILGVGSAVFFTWSWLYHRLRVRIDMQEKGAAAKAGAAAIVTHLRDLGAAPPTGLEAPLGTDAETLTGSNITSSVKGILATLVGLLQAALAITPWRILVDTVSIPASGAETGAETKSSSTDIARSVGADSKTVDVTVVMVSHHGRVVDSAIIRPWLDTPTSPRVNPYKMVAARALMSILRTQDDYAGLGGARNWRSVGLQYEATTGEHSPAEQRALLAKAVELDPQNWSARMGYRMKLQFNSTDLDTLASLASWLREAAAVQGQGDEALKARMLFASYATVQNYDFVARTAGANATKTVTPPAAASIREELDAAIADAKLDSSFRESISIAAVALTRPAPAGPQVIPLPSDYEPASAGGTLGRGVTQREWLLTDLTMAYAWACWSAVEASKETDPKRREEKYDQALRFLQFAHGDADVREQVDGDQTFEELRRTTAFRRRFGAKPQTDIMAIEPFKNRASELKAAALTNAADIAQLGPWRLKRLIGTNMTTATHLLVNARLAARVTECVPTHPVDVLEVLHKAKVTNIEALGTVVQDPTRAIAIRAAILERCVDAGLPDPEETALDSLLGLK
ncbi:hypothetical protein [Nocardioides sp.]|uniref:hypothetical protein n=1 Tax=Nocardioides sp. TaxID=35761 RepID=UPI003783048D